MSVYIHNVFVYCTFHNLLHNMLLLFAAYLKSNRNIHKNVITSDYSFSCSYTIHPARISPSPCVCSHLWLYPYHLVFLFVLWHFQICQGYLESMQLLSPSSPKLQPNFFPWSLLQLWHIFQIVPIMVLVFLLGISLLKSCMQLLPSGHINCHWFFLFMPKA